MTYPQKPKQTEAEILKEARAIHAKRALQRKTKKEKEGYKFFVYAEGSGNPKHHKIYFRNLKSAIAWMNKRMGSVYELSTNKEVWSNINQPLEIKKK